MFKKSFALLLALVMCLGILAGCQQEPVETTKPTETTTPVETTQATEPAPTEYEFPEGATIDIWTSRDLQGSMLEGFISNASGLNVEFVLADEQKYMAALTNKVTPSVIFGWMNNTVNNYGRYGAYVNFYDYKDIMPNFFAKYEEAEYYHELCELSDGEMYMIPALLNGDVQNVCWIYREDIFAEAGITEVPTDWDSFYACLKTLKEKYPESYPLCFRQLNNSKMSLFANLAQQWGVNYDSVNFLSHNPADNTYYQGASTDEMRVLLQHFKILLDEGLLHPGSMSFGTAEWKAAMTDGTSFITHDKAFQVDSIESAGKGADENYSLAWFNNIPMVESDMAYSCKNNISTAVWFVTTRCPDVELACRYIDWLFTDEGTLATCWGEEGVSYGVNENGKKYFLDSFPAEERAQMAMYSNTANIDFEATLATYSEKAQACILDCMEAAKNGDYNDKTLSFNAADQKIVSTYVANYRDVRASYLQKFLLGQLDINNDAHWQEYKDALAANGEAELIAAYERSYAEFFGD